MAHSAQPIRKIHFFAGGGALALLLLLTLGTVIAVWMRAELKSGLSPSDWAAIRFTLSQALLSAVISCAVAIPTARALARRKFWGRGALVSLMGAPFILPAIVAVLGILAIWGRAGLFSKMIEPFGYSPINIYGFAGVVMAHVFFNLPLATRLILQGWQAIPSEHFRLAAELEMKTADVARHLEWPMLRTVLPSAFLLIFLLCISSFAVALALGGGPKATTVELAIFQALRFDFDLSKAAQLAVIQFSLCAVLALLTMILTKPLHFSLGMDRPLERWDSPKGLWLYADIVILGIVGTFLFLPLASILLRGFIPMFTLPIEVYFAALNSVLVSVCSAILTILLSLALASFVIRIARRRRGVSRTIEGLGFITLAASPFVVGTGLFVILFPILDPFKIALPVTTLVNAAMSLPFAMRVILPALWRAEGHYGRLSDTLGLEQWARFRIAIWPRLKRPVGFAAGLSAALSMGDLGVIALFAPPDVATLPLMMHRLMAAYQMEAAAGAALLLVGLSLLLFWLFDRGGRLEHHIR